MSLLPKTRLGWISVMLVAAFWGIIGIFQLLILSGQRGGDTFFSNPILAVTVLAAGACGIGALIIGVISIGFRRERSVPVFLSAAFGLLVLTFFLGEILSPH